MRRAACGAVIAACGLVGGACSPGDRDSLSSHTDEAFRWSIEYPEEWHLDTSFGESRISVWETTVANFDAESNLFESVVWLARGVRTSLEREDRLADFPQDGVALRIFHREGGPAPDLHIAEAEFPLALSDFGRSGHPLLRLPPNASMSSAPTPLVHSFGANGWEFSAAAWIGPEASMDDRALLERVIASLRFPSLREGGIAAGGRFDVLGRAGEYPVESATSFGPEGEGYHLVHAPGGFYALRGYCQDDPRFNLVHFDRLTFEFTCPDGGRWDRIGAPLGRDDSPLMVLPAKVAQDGHVLVARESYTFSSGRMRAKFWPP